MQKEIVESIKHIKKSKKRLQLTRYLQTSKKYSTIPFNDLIKTLDTMAKYYILHESESDESITYLIVEDPDSVFVPDTQDIFNISNSNLFNGDQEITLEEANLEHEKSTQEDISLTSSDNILNEIKSFEKL